MLDQLETKALPAADDSARNALHEEAMRTSSKTPETHQTSTNTKPLQAPARDAQKDSSGAESATEKSGTLFIPNHKAEQSKFFKDLYQKTNFDLDPIKTGDGALQSLEQMVKEGKITLSDKVDKDGKPSDQNASSDSKITLSHEQLLDEAKRIQDRDFKELGRNYYTPTDHIKRWSDQEIDKGVQAAVDKPKGIDISNWQHSVDWKQVKDAGYQFVMMKASEGVDFVDPTFDAYRKGAHDAGLKEGYYHYFHPHDPVADQVKNFVKAVGKAEPDSLRMVIDAEDPSQWAAYTPAQRVKMIDDFCQGVKNSLGITPEVLIYCSGSFANETLANSPILAKYPLWIASWGVPNPTVPEPWGNWNYWQFTDAGKVPGIDGKVDLDMFNGTDLSKDHLKPERQK